MKTELVCLFLSVCLASMVYAVNPTAIPVESWPHGMAGNGNIYYQNSDFFTFKNVKNPVKVMISYTTGSNNTEASVCLNSYQTTLPISGVNLEENCPAGAFGNVANTTMVDPLFKIRKTFNTKSRFLRDKLALSDDGDSFDDTTSEYASLYVKPGTNSGGFIVTLPDSEVDTHFYLYLSGEECDNGLYPVAADGSCVAIPAISTNNNVYSLPDAAAESWYYYSVTFSSNSFNSATFSVNGTSDDVEVFLQQDYYPDSNWHLNAIDEIDDDEGLVSATILNPGSQSGSQTYFIGVHTITAGSYVLNATFSTCNSGFFGYNCVHDSAVTNDPAMGFQPLDANLATNPNGTEPMSYDFGDNDYEGDFAYFSLTNLPTSASIQGLTNPYFVRVTVGSNNVKDGAPGFFAKQGGYPSPQSNFYNVSTEDDVSHQIIVPISTQDLTQDPSKVWWFAVQLPADFSIWVGVNCAGDCADEEHGNCYCGAELCSTATSNNTVLNAYYEFPTSTVDSGGACTCVDDDYDSSFDCGTKNNPNIWIWIIVVIVAIVIIVCIAILVPLVFLYLQRQKQRANYDYVDDGN